MRRHMWMHVGILAAILALFGLRSAGVTIPTAVVYAVLLACPLMMVFMMFGMDHHEEEVARESQLDREHQSHPPADTSR